MAAVLSCGRGAVLSHRSAAALLGVGEEPRGVIEVSVRRGSSRRRPGLIVHRRPKLRQVDVGTCAGVPTTSPVQTLIDLATQLDRSDVERAVNEADILGLVSAERLRAELDGRTGQPGVGRLRAVLDRRTFRFTRSELERRFLPLAREAGMSTPLTAQRVNGFEVDFHWPDLDLVVETDGLRYHRTPAEQGRDRRRDQAHTVAGVSFLRFTHEQIRYEPDHVRRVLAGTHRRLRAADRGSKPSRDGGPYA